MLKDFQKAFRISDEDLAQLRNGEMSASVQKNIGGTSNLFLGIGILLCLTGLFSLLKGTDNALIVFSILFLTGLLALYGGYNLRQGVFAGKIETLQTKIRVFEGTGAYRSVVLGDKSTFRVGKNKTKLVQKDTEYIVYYIKQGNQLIMIEPIDNR